MRKASLFVLISIGLLLLSGCTLRSDAADLYKQEMPLQAEVRMPEVLSPDEEVMLEVVMRQNGELLEKADFVHFEIWKQDGSKRYPMEEAVGSGEGVYQLPIQFESDGLYYLEVHAGNNGSLISPQHQFVVGKLSDSELESLKQGPLPVEEAPVHHH